MLLESSPTWSLILLYVATRLAASHTGHLLNVSTFFIFPAKQIMTTSLDAYNLDIPGEVMEHPIIVSLGEAANDLVTWSNVSVSFSMVGCPSLFFSHLSRTSSHTTSNNPRETRTTRFPS